MTTLIIVESPTKAQTLQQFLPAEYHVAASYGHICDLPPRELGVDVEHDFRATYEVPRSKQRTLQNLRRRARQADAVILAMDPDREGEAIAWHLQEQLKRDLPPTVHRATFHEITTAAVQHALDHPTTLNLPLVHAQEARRILDRLVGYGLSPVVSHALQQRGLSAGRVQTATLRLVYEREQARAHFVPTSTYSVEAVLHKDDQELTATLQNENHQPRLVNSPEEAETLCAPLREIAIYIVMHIKAKEQQRRPKPPFTTSTLQQEANKELGYGAAETMQYAQKLFETGHITYMRTDSVAVAPEAQEQARQVIAARFAPEYLPPKPPQYQTKNAAAQEAHEAIRPTEPTRSPAELAGHLDPALHTLYDLIWRRFIASQMAPARIQSVSAYISPQGQPHILRAQGVVPLFPGYRALYQEPEEREQNRREKQLPPLTDGDELTLHHLQPKEHRTKPPAPFTEATLIKELEDGGIGRPSTYASTLATLFTRAYIETTGKKKILQTTPTGQRVLELLLQYTPDFFQVDYTARLEQELDLIAQGELPQLTFLQQFYAAFQPGLEHFRHATGYRPRAAAERTEHQCPQCKQGYLVKRVGTKGPFLGCERYPDCRYTQPVDTPIPDLLYTCPLCTKGKLVQRTGPRGDFLGCNRYPDCRYSQPIDLPVPDQLETCPECEQGKLTMRVGREGPFWGCSTYPQCKYTAPYDEEEEETP